MNAEIDEALNGWYWTRADDIGWCYPWTPDSMQGRIGILEREFELLCDRND